MIALAISTMGCIIASHVVVLIERNILVKRVLALIVLSLLTIACNSEPPLTEGTVVNRRFEPAHWEDGYRNEPRYGYHCGLGYDGKYGCGMKHYTEQVYEEHHHFVEDKFKLQLKDCKQNDEGENKCRTDWITVPEFEYSQYKVGNHYPDPN